MRQLLFLLVVGQAKPSLGATVEGADHPLYVPDAGGGGEPRTAAQVQGGGGGGGTARGGHSVTALRSQAPEG